MKRMKYFGLAFSVMLCMLCGCSKVELAGITDVVYVDIPMSYTKVEVSSIIEVRFSEDCTSPQLEADVNIMPYIKIYEKKGTLMVELAKGLKLDDSGWAAFKAVVTLPPKRDIESVALSGAALLVSDVLFGNDRFCLTASGASSFTGAVEADEFDLNLSGASLAECGFLKCGNMRFTASGASLAKLSGSVSSCDMSLSGASTLGDIQVGTPYSLEIDRCTGVLSGASLATFRSDGEIRCTLSGGSSIYYSGDADVSGSVSDSVSSIVQETGKR